MLYPALNVKPYCNLLKSSILLCLMAVTKPGDTIIIGKPTYFGIFNIIKNLGLKILEIDIHPSTGLNLNYLEECLQEIKVSACLFISNFNSPTGYCMTDFEKHKLVEILARREHLEAIRPSEHRQINWHRRLKKPCYDCYGICSRFVKIHVMIVMEYVPGSEKTLL